MSEIIIREGYLKDLLKLTYAIRPRPEIYIGYKSIYKLYYFLDGFSRAYHYIDLEEKHFEVYPGFQEWICSKYGAKPSKTWGDVMLDYAGNEVEALELFFKEIEIYIKEKGWDRMLDKKSE